MKAQDHLGLVNSITNKRFQQFKHKYDYQDIFQTGCVGLMKAIKNYNPSIGVAFGIYAYQCIDKTILTAIRDDRWYLGNRKTRMLSKPPKSLNYEYEDNEEFEKYLGSEDESFENIELKIVIEKLPKELSNILDLIYFKDVKQNDIADMLGISKTTVYRLKMRALEMLKYELSC